MSIQYRKDFDILEKLKEAGYTTYRLRVEHLLAESSLQAIREGRMVRLEVIDKLCSLLNCEIEDLIEYIPDTGHTLTYEIPQNSDTMMVAESSVFDTLRGNDLHFL